MLNRLSFWLLLTLLTAMPAGAHSQSAVPAADRQQATAAPVMRLSLRDAVALALAPEGNTRVQLAEELIRQARAFANDSRSALLPNLTASVGQQSQTRNLEAAGLSFSAPIPGFAFPRMVGPFNIFDARATATQSLLNLGALRRYQAANTGVGAAQAERDDTHDQVRAQVAKAYLSAVRAEASLEAARANVELSQALLKLAEDQKTAGTGTGIEITRAQVQLANEQQRLLVARNELAASNLQLLRAMHLDMATSLELTDKLAFQPMEAVAPEQAMQTALQTRSDWKAQQKRIESAGLRQSASRMDRLPSIGLFADYGSIGSSINNAIPTRTYGFIVKVPVFDGGGLEARRAESASQYRQELIRGEDLRAQVELEVRLALDSLQSAAEQVTAAEEGLTLAGNELAQAERRFRAGVGTGVEVTDAQTRLERARDNRISALFAYNAARIDLSLAMGTIDRLVQ